MKFRIGRHLRSRLHLIWMTISLMVVILLPFILGIGLYIKSTLLLEDKEFGELLFSSDWSRFPEISDSLLLPSVLSGSLHYPC